jgi:hypothetical protein
MSSTIWNFETEHVTGRFFSDGLALKSTINDRKTGDEVGEILLPYRLLSRSGWHGEARDMPHTARLLDDGIECEWSPTVSHPSTLRITTRLALPHAIDIEVEVRADATLPDYELFYSCYFRRPMCGGGYVASLPREQPTVPGWTQVVPQSADFYREMYVAFPRDERAAALICDGRWQRGRHFTRFLPCRYHAAPLGFYWNNTTSLCALLMAPPEDAYSVSMAYQTTEERDDVGHHNSLYISLFGRDIHAGETARARLRMVLDRSGCDPTAHHGHYRAFLDT